ncbi:uncharacterized protein LOC114277633 [Camellia sinensis]|uniref:uncharacterized protein LOC114277633 n=1 Tax=Camellia sinensis TaxID=4442 RepID=UPI001035C54F|nr:uncharacterized protein LOC114277633 [Camellia sinensis]
MVAGGVVMVAKVRWWQVAGGVGGGATGRGKTMVESGGMWARKTVVESDIMTAMGGWWWQWWWWRIGWCGVSGWVTCGGGGEWGRGVVVAWRGGVVAWRSGGGLVVWKTVVVAVVGWLARSVVVVAGRGGDGGGGDLVFSFVIVLPFVAAYLVLEQWKL